MKFLVTGGAGFVGASLAAAFRRAAPGHDVLVLDNLKRRGSELNLPLFRSLGVRFVHGAVRSPSDLASLGETFDVFLDCSAEPSVTAGVGGSPRYVVETNLFGTLNCLEFAEKNCGATLFLSTSRVYSIEPLLGIRLEEKATRFVPAAQSMPGFSPRGIAEDFPVHLPRSFYGASKLASEHLIQEYAHSKKMKAIVNRCGVLAGPGQFGKVDQGVFTHWVASHAFRRPLRYTGFGGTGKQVRDLLHPGDLFDLLTSQIERLDSHAGKVFNVGGGLEGSTSLLELTGLCREITGQEVPVTSVAETSSVDVPWYVTDASAAQRAFDWKPKRSVADIVKETAGWLKANEASLKEIL